MRLADFFMLQYSDNTMDYKFIKRTDKNCIKCYTKNNYLNLNLLVNEYWIYIKKNNIITELDL